MDSFSLLQDLIYPLLVSAYQFRWFKSRFYFADRFYVSQNLLQLLSSLTLLNRGIDELICLTVFKGCAICRIERCKKVAD